MFSACIEQETDHGKQQRIDHFSSTDHQCNSPLAEIYPLWWPSLSTMKKSQTPLQCQALSRLHRLPYKALQSFQRESCTPKGLKWRIGHFVKSNNGCAVLFTSQRSKRMQRYPPRTLSHPYRSAKACVINHSVSFVPCLTSRTFTGLTCLVTLLPLPVKCYERRRSTCSDHPT